MNKVSLTLWLLYAAFLTRVAGQALVAINQVSWLPAFEHWHSGLMPYSLLLCFQVLILIVFAKVARDITTNTGYFSLPRPELAHSLRRFALIYFAIMGLRFIICQFLISDLSRLAPIIPTIFHFVLASFILLAANVLDPQRRRMLQQR